MVIADLDISSWLNNFCNRSTLILTTSLRSDQVAVSLDLDCYDSAKMLTLIILVLSFHFCLVFMEVAGSKLDLDLS